MHSSESCAAGQKSSIGSLPWSPIHPEFISDR
jgi:hypothetical protein